VTVTGSRAATGYGAHVADAMAADLAEHGWHIVSGGAYGDAAAHLGALAVGGPTLAVLAGGVDQPYPAGHPDLFGRIADGGLLVSEWPSPGSHPTRARSRSSPRSPLPPWSSRRARSAAADHREAKGWPQSARSLRNWQRQSRSGTAIRYVGRCAGHSGAVLAAGPDGVEPAQELGIVATP
jgi:hypothetical protein